jgi:hypothetical protein
MAAQNEPPTREAMLCYIMHNHVYILAGSQLRTSCFNLTMSLIQSEVGDQPLARHPALYESESGVHVNFGLFNDTSVSSLYAFFHMHMAQLQCPAEG